MEQAIIYANEQCNYCKSIKKTLKDRDINFKIRLTNDFKQEWQEVISLTGMSMLPTISFKGAVFVPGRDFSNPEHLVNILQTYERPLYDDTKNTLEKLKTLNFNIHSAFSRLEKILIEIEKNTKKDEHKSTD